MFVFSYCRRLQKKVQYLCMQDDVCKPKPRMNVIYAHMQCAPCGYGDMYLNVLCGMYSFEPMFLFGTSSHHIIQVLLPRKMSWNICIIFSPHI